MEQGIEVKFAIHPYNISAQYTCSDIFPSCNIDDSELLKSSDGGISWQPADSGLGEPFPPDPAPCAGNRPQ
jgi:hypothetical protein